MNDITTNVAGITPRLMPLPVRIVDSLEQSGCMGRVTQSNFVLF